MSSWRDAILNDFVPNVSKLTIVSDPDGLLIEEKMALELRQRGFDLIEFNDPSEFRNTYESKYRSIWDRGGKTELAVVLCLHGAELESLPYDLLQAGRRLAFNLGELFPNLSYSVIEKLDRGLLDILFDAQNKASPDCMGDNATKDFILRYVFGIAAELIANEVDLLRSLIRLHYNRQSLPRILAERFVQVLRGNGDFQEWSLEEIVTDDEAFFAFLQERWPIFLSSFGKSSVLEKDTSKFMFKYSGPAILPFEHHDIRICIDNLFVEGKLTPVQIPNLFVGEKSWVQCGVISSDDGDMRISRFFDLIKQDLTKEKIRYSDWTVFALKWAELSSLVHCSGKVTHKTRLIELGNGLNKTFGRWLSEHYASLINLPPNNPAMLHHVARRLARDIESSGGRVALIVVDGLALDQWVTVRQFLQQQVANIVMREAATFAWIPTLTSVSRQAIFSGNPPHCFPSSIYTTNSEERLWKQFWEDNGFSRLDITYQRGLGDGDVQSVLESTVHPGQTKVVGLVVDKVDKITHGMQLGAAGMHNQIKLWCENGFLGNLISYLLDSRYKVWLTSDHGNTECVGNGRPMEGSIAETRGDRVRVYPTPELRSQVAKSFPSAYEWKPVGLPTDYYPLVAGGRDAFINAGETIVGHGGLAIEEVIVPLVKFERQTRK